KKPLKEVSFSVPNITATMTSQQFQTLTDIIMNLALAPTPKLKKPKVRPDADEDEEEEEEYGSRPDGVPEVEAAEVKAEVAQRAVNALIQDLWSTAALTASRAHGPELAFAGSWDGGGGGGGNAGVFGSGRLVLEEEDPNHKSLVLAPPMVLVSVLFPW
ncbi:unnamed protein product, partial [Closterium sp. NIES-54]